MLNINTAYKFDPNKPGLDGIDIDGSNQMQINLAAFRRVAQMAILAAAEHLQRRCTVTAQSPNRLVGILQ